MTGLLMFAIACASLPLWCLVSDVRSIASSLEDMAYELKLIRQNKTTDLDTEENNNGNESKT